MLILPAEVVAADFGMSAAQLAQSLQTQGVAPSSSLMRGKF